MYMYVNKVVSIMEYICMRFRYKLVLFKTD